MSPADFVSQVRSELRRVVWPSQHETFGMTVAVILMVVAAMVYFFVSDAFVCFVLEKIL